MAACAQVEIPFLPDPLSVLQKVPTPSDIYSYNPPPPARPHPNRDHCPATHPGAHPRTDLNSHAATHATTYRHRRWKLTMFHGKDFYELFDVENDPREHDELSDDPGNRDIKWDLIRKNFDATVLAHPIDPPTPRPSSGHSPSILTSVRS